jgi:hypothetical protein
MRTMNKRGQAEIMDGLILMLIAATCAVVLLSVSSGYGTLAVKIYEETYSQKLAQNTLLSLYHITDQKKDSDFYRKSIMVAVSQELTKGNRDFTEAKNMELRARILIQDVLDKYSAELGRNFLFALTDGSDMIDESIISTADNAKTEEDFRANAGAAYCASAALTYMPNAAGNCVTASSKASSMCYQIFEICTWLT